MNMFVLTMLFPLLSFIILTVSREKWSKNTSAIVGTSGIGISMLITFYLIYKNCILDNCIDFVLFQDLWSWFKINDLHVQMTFRLDQLSLTMLSMITGVGFIIHIYAIWYMRSSEEYARFFSYTNLFIFNMIILVLSDNLLLIYLGWEGVGLCSYLLIGFYNFNPKNGLEAFKAFVMTRFGDICLMCALLMIYDRYHTLSLDVLLQLTPDGLVNNMSTWISIMLLLGCLGKSAQLPLQTWLVSAMVGPTPVSALIHAATMVTSGVYLINRLYNFFLITPCILYVIGIIGAITLIISACSALFQSSVKKILAYSTISQIGYMFLAIGEKNWFGSIFHLTTHSVFKALLFLSAGILIKFCQNEQNIFKMGGLCRSIPMVYICFLIGGISLSGLPIVTSGFYSKECILLYTFNSNSNNFFLFAELIGLLLTSMYTFRMIFVIFHGKQLIAPKVDNKFYQYISLIVLSLFSTMIGVRIQLPLLHITMSNHYTHSQLSLVLISEILMFLGIWISSLFWLKISSKTELCTMIPSQLEERITRYWILICHYGWGIDYIYRIIFINPYLLTTKKLFNCMNHINTTISVFMIFNWLGKNLMYIEYSKLNWYIAVLNIGIVIILLLSFINL